MAKKKEVPLQIESERADLWLGRLWSDAWDADVIYCAGETLEEAIYEASVLGFSTEVFED